MRDRIDRTQTRASRNERAGAALPLGAGRRKKR